MLERIKLLPDSPAKLSLLNVKSSKIIGMNIQEDLKILAKVLFSMLQRVSKR